MKKQKNQPTWYQMLLSLVIAGLMGWLFYNSLEALIDYMIRETLHSWLAPAIPIVGVFLVFLLVILSVWIAFKLASKMAEQNKKASDI